MRLGLRPSDANVLLEPGERAARPTDWVQRISTNTDLTIAEMEARYLMVDGNSVLFTPSAIPNAGLGVKVMGAVAAGTVITKYEGALVNILVLQAVKSRLPRASPLLPLLTSHAIRVNLLWGVLGNFESDTPQLAGGDVLARMGLYHVNNPQRAMRGKGLAGFINTLEPGDEAHLPGVNFNVKFEVVEDYTLEGPDHDKARFFEKPAGGYIMAAVAARDIRADEELFAFYNRGGGSGSPLDGAAAAPPPPAPEPHMQITWQGATSSPSSEKD